MTLNSTFQLNNLQTTHKTPKTQLESLIEAVSQHLNLDQTEIIKEGIQGQTNYPQFLVFSIAHYQFKMPVQNIAIFFNKDCDQVLFGIKRLAEWSSGSEIKQDFQTVIETV